MYLIFHKNKFVDICKNTKTQTFLTPMLKGMRWKKEDVKVYGFLDLDDEKVADFLEHMDSDNKCCCLKVGDSGFVRKIKYETYTDVHRQVLPSDDDGSNFYTAQEIADYAENGVIGKKYFEDLALWEASDKTVVAPELKFPKKHPKFKFQNFMENMAYEILDELQGQIINLDLRFAAEAVAIKKINTVKAKMKRETALDKVNKGAK